MFKDFANIVQAIASVVNLIIVVLFFVFDRIQGSFSLKRERKEYWYRETMLNRGIQEVEISYDELKGNLQKAEDIYESQIYDQNTENEIRKIICEINTTIASLKNLLRCYSKLFDEKLYSTIRLTVEEQGDKLTTGIETNYQNQSSNYKLQRDLNLFRYHVLNIIYTYDTTMGKQVKS